MVDFPEPLSPISAIRSPATVLNESFENNNDSEYTKSSESIDDDKKEI